MILKLRRLLDKQQNLYSVSNGEPGDDVNFNSSFVSREVDDSKAAKLDLTDAGSSTVSDTQKNIVDEATWSGRILNGVSGVPVWVSNLIGSIADNVRQRVEAIQAAVETNQTDIGTNATDIGTNATNIGLNTSDIADLRTTTGTSDGDTDMGVYSGAIISDNISQAAINQELETAIENVPLPLTFKGTWDANTNAPALASGVGTNGDVYIVSVSGATNLDGITDWVITDWAVFNGTAWVKVDNSEASTGADLFLSNLTAPTSIPVDLIPTNSAVTDLGSASKRYAEAHMTTLYARDIFQSTAGNQPLDIQTVANSSTGNIDIQTGNASAGPSGNIILQPGTATGTRGSIILQDGSEVSPGIGAVWTQKGVSGEGEWAENSGGGTGFRNLLSNQDSTFEVEDTVGGWLTFDDGGGGYDNGDGGSPTVITIQTEKSTALVGDRSLEILKAALDATGEGLSVGFMAVDLNLRGRDLQGSLEYDFSDANYTSGDATIKAYDQTNANELTVIDGDIPAGNGKLNFGVIGLQDSTALVRLSIYWQTDNATGSAYSSFIDEIRLGDEGPVQGVTFGTDWLPYTPVVSQLGTVSAVDFKYRQDGPDILVQGELTTGTIGAGEVQIGLPPGMAVGAAVSGPTVAGMYLRDVSAITHGGGLIATAGDTYFNVGPATTFNSTISNPVQPANAPQFCGNTERVTFEARIPIAGLQSGANLPVQVGLEDGVIMSVAKNAGSSGAASAITGWDSPDKDTTNSFNTSTGIFTVPQDGDYYAVWHYDTPSDTNSEGTIYVNGSEFMRSTVMQGGGEGSLISGIIPGLVSGDTVSPRTVTARSFAGGTTKNRFSIYKIPSPIVNLGTTNKVAYIKDVKASGQVGGASIAGTQVRVLNTIDGDQSFISLNSNQLTIAPGKYRYRGSCPAYYVDAHQAILYNFSDSQNVPGGEGTAEFTDNSGGGWTTRSIVSGVFTIASEKVFELRHYTALARASNGLGVASSNGNNQIFSELEIEKVK
jgi:hypothetical protein